MSLQLAPGAGARTEIGIVPPNATAEIEIETETASVSAHFRRCCWDPPFQLLRVRLSFNGCNSHLRLHPRGVVLQAIETMTATGTATVTVTVIGTATESATGTATGTATMSGITTVLFLACSHEQFDASRVTSMYRQPPHTHTYTHAHTRTHTHTPPPPPPSRPRPPDTRFMAA